MTYDKEERTGLENALVKAKQAVESACVMSTFDYHRSDRRRFCDLGDDTGKYLGNELKAAADALQRAENILRMYR